MIYIDHVRSCIFSVIGAPVNTTTWLSALPFCPILPRPQIISLPLDTAKVRLQLQPKSAAPKYK